MPDYDFVHTGPDTIAGRYMRMFWQPVCRSNDLKAGRAIPLRIMNEDFTLHRGNSGAPFVVGPRCAHRRTRLSVGRVESDCIRCLYHGWKYDGGGRCIDQPAEPVGFTKDVGIAGYPTREYLGLIFAYLGGGQAPALPRFLSLKLKAFSKSKCWRVRATISTASITPAIRCTRSLPTATCV